MDRQDLQLEEFRVPEAVRLPLHRLHPLDRMPRSTHPVRRAILRECQTPFGKVGEAEKGSGGRNGVSNRYLRFPTTLPSASAPLPSAWTLMTYGVLAVGPRPEFGLRPRFRPVARAYRRPCFLSRASAQRASAFVRRGSGSSA
jgi:hypothetical protein